MSITAAVRTAREDADRHGHRNDGRIVEALDRIDAAVADLGDLLRGNTPAGLTTSYLTDARVYTIAEFAAEIRRSIGGDLYAETNTAPTPPVAANPGQIFAFSANDLGVIKGTCFRNGFDAGWDAASGETIEVAE